MHTLFVGELGYGDVAAEAALVEAMAANRAEEPFVLTADPDRVALIAPRARPVIDTQEKIEGRFERVVIFGPIFSDVRFDRALAAAAAALDGGGQAVMHNVTLPRLPAILKPRTESMATLLRLDGLAARDHRALEIMGEWQLETLGRLLYYPERSLLADDHLLFEVDGSPILGISVRPTAPTRAAWQVSRDRVAAVLQEFGGWTVLPLVASMPGPKGGEDDAAAFREFIQTFLPESRIALPNLLDRPWWRGNVTPQRLKALVGRCDAVVTQRDVVAAFAVEREVRVLGLAPDNDNRVSWCLSSLANQLARRSTYHALPSRAPQAA